MRHLIAALILTVGAVGCCPACRGAEPVAASVRVCAPLADGQLGSGTGTVIAAAGGRCIILTNRHVCPVESDNIVVDWSDGKRAVGRRYAVARVADLAAVLVEKAPAGVVACPVASRPPEVGEELTQASYTAGCGPVRRHGPFKAACDGYRDGRPVSRAVIENHPGDSGSALFRGDQVVAVVWGGTLDCQTSLCVCYEDVAEFCSSVPMKIVCPVTGKPCTCGCADGKACTCAKAPVKSADGNYMLAGWYSSAGVWQYDFWVYCGPVKSQPVYAMPRAGVLGDCPNCRRR